MRIAPGQQFVNVIDDKPGGELARLRKVSARSETPEGRVAAVEDFTRGSLRPDGFAIGDRGTFLLHCRTPIKPRSRGMGAILPGRNRRVMAANSPELSALRLAQMDDVRHGVRRHSVALRRYCEGALGRRSIAVLPGCSLLDQ